MKKANAGIKKTYNFEAMKNLTLLIIIILCFPFQAVLAQRPDYKKEWKEIETFENKGLPQSALQKARSIYSDALSSTNEPQLVKAVMHIMKYVNQTEESESKINYFFLDSLIAKSNTPLKNIYQSMQAEVLLNYRVNNLYALFDRSRMASDTSGDFSTWSIDKLNKEISRRYKQSIENPEKLQKIPTHYFAAVLTKGVNSKGLRPSLYDLLCHRALSFFSDKETGTSISAFGYMLSDPLIFDQASAFVRMPVIPEDSESRLSTAVNIYQSLTEFHLTGNNREALADLELNRFEFGYEHGVFSKKDLLYEQALRTFEKNHEGLPVSATAMFKRAQLYARNGEHYDMLLSPQSRWNKKNAAQLCDSIISTYPESEGAALASDLLMTLKLRSLNVITETAVIPGEASKALIQYRNISYIHFRIIRIDETSHKSLTVLEYEEQFRKLAGQKPVADFNLALPGTEDLHEHAAEMMIEPLSPGIYVLLGSMDKLFNYAANYSSINYFHCSNISYIKEGKDHFILHRKTGLPLADAKITIWENVYDNVSRRYIDQQTGTATTDRNGYFRLEDRRFNQYMLDITWKSERLFIREGKYSNPSIPAVKDERPGGFLFTDRAIYRPGQTLYFKGILFNDDTDASKRKVAAGISSRILVSDANGRNIYRNDVMSNEFGSYHGSFRIPESSLNGTFLIRDSASGQTVTVRVEDYKRPRFKINLQAPEGSYKIYDSIKLTGKAIAYSGADMNDATVVYRVIRKTIIPRRGKLGYRDMIWPPRPYPETEISNGRLKSDENGTFHIIFPAIPEPTADSSLNPVFYYEVTAEVTDLSGETQSGQIVIAVSHQPLFLDVSGPEELSTDSLSLIKLFSRNINSGSIKRTATAEFRQLTAPSSPYRERYWKAPDQFIIAKDVFKRNFPSDAYADENLISNWPKSVILMTMTDTTEPGGNFFRKGLNIKPGWYSILFKTTDDSGREISEERFFFFHDKSTDAFAGKTVRAGFIKKSASPGQEVRYFLSTSFDQVNLVFSKSSRANTESFELIEIRKGAAYENSFLISENDRGGIILNFSSIKENRLYSGSMFVEVPWTNKELEISLETFRDKLTPGSDEKWKIKMRPKEGEVLASEWLAAMYDASLDKFTPHQWDRIMRLWPNFMTGKNWFSDNLKQKWGQQLDLITVTSFKTYPKSYTEFSNIGWSAAYGHFQTGIVMADGAPVMYRQNEAVVKQSAPVGEPRAKAEKNDQKAAPPAPGENISIRKNLSETAFFYPELRTDSSGGIEISFPIPEALTNWRFMLQVHTKDLASGYQEKMATTSKPIMVLPNLPRFMVAGDKVDISTKIANLEKTEFTGTARLEITNLITGQSADGWFRNMLPVQYFTTAPGESEVIRFPIEIPNDFSGPVSIRITAITNDGIFSDGEESAIPVLTRKIPVIESMPFIVREAGKKAMNFESLLHSGESSTLVNRSFTLEYSLNPSWYVIQAIPYLAQQSIECSENLFNNYAANLMGSYIIHSDPSIKRTITDWSTKESSALQSNLSKNEDLKNIMLEETPWLMESGNEEQSKKRLSDFFNEEKTSANQASLIKKIIALQTSNGGFSWMAGGPDDRYITQYILCGLAHLKQLRLLGNEEKIKWEDAIRKAIAYSDSRIKDDFDLLIKQKATTQKYISPYAVQYLYTRSQFQEYPLAGNSEKAVTYFKSQAEKYWTSAGKYLQAMIALALHRFEQKGIESTGANIKKGNTPAMIIESLRQYSIIREDYGMYWKEFTTGSYYWHQSPIEAQAMMIEAFAEIDGRNKPVDDMKTWLLRNKQTNNWKNSRATAEACFALLLRGTEWTGKSRTISVKAGNYEFPVSTPEAGTGYYRETIPAEKVSSVLGNISIEAKGDIKKEGPPVWGSFYWQYLEDADKVRASAAEIAVEKKLMLVTLNERGEMLKEIEEGDEIRVGDKIRARIIIRSDRDMEYVHMKDMRGACLEPVQVLSGYTFRSGLGFYESTRDAATHFFIPYIRKGNYVFEYDMHASQTGQYSSGPCSIQCLYAPEFNSHSKGMNIEVLERR